MNHNGSKPVIRAHETPWASAFLPLSLFFLRLRLFFPSELAEKSIVMSMALLVLLSIFPYFTRDRAHVSLQADNGQAGIGGRKGLGGKTHAHGDRGRHTWMEMLNPQKFRGEERFSL